MGVKRRCAAFGYRGWWMGVKGPNAAQRRARVGAVLLVAARNRARIQLRGGTEHVRVAVPIEREVTRTRSVVATDGLTAL